MTRFGAGAASSQLTVKQWLEARGWTALVDNPLHYDWLLRCTSPDSWQVDLYLDSRLDFWFASEVQLNDTQRNSMLALNYGRKVAVMHAMKDTLFGLGLFADCDLTNFEEQDEPVSNFKILKNWGVNLLDEESVFRTLGTVRQGWAEVHAVAQDVPGRV